MQGFLLFLCLFVACVWNGMIATWGFLYRFGDYSLYYFREHT